MQLDFQRYECKYIIPSSLCEALKSHIACYTHPDRFTAQSPPGGYRITSLYLDDARMTFHQAKQRKDLNRLKLRIRIYDDGVDGPVFFEIKRKIKGIIFKRRVMVKARDWVAGMDGGESLVKSARTERDASVLGEFLSIKDRVGAGPAVLVKYSREAFQGEIDDYSRVTFDSRLVCRAPSGYRFATGYEGWSPIDHPIAVERADSGVILELKFANRAPTWMVDLVSRFGLQLRGFSKYSTSVDQIRERYQLGHDMRLPRRQHA